MTTERSSYTDVFRQWVETSEQLNNRLDELRPINMQIDDGNHDPTVVAANCRLQDEIGRLHQRRDELNAELIRLTAAGSV